MDIVPHSDKYHFTDRHNKPMESTVFMSPHCDFLNLGCGTRYNRDWVNVDCCATVPDVIAWDLRKGIPFPDASFRVIYHSHLLEHYNRIDAMTFLLECQRVLKVDGILRVVVPDLEVIVRTYLEVLENMNSGSPDGVVNYEWMMLELYDQAVRNVSGGSMAEYLMQPEIINEEFVFSRCGVEARKLREIAQRKYSNSSSMLLEPLCKIKNMLVRIKCLPMYIREWIVKKLLGVDYEALRIGRFRLAGEVHQWMYDRYSLRRLLASCGFVEIVQRNALESYIPNWSGYNLDTEADGSTFKPDSMYMEAIKP